MQEISKRLVEVEYILKNLENEYQKKIPKEIWDYLNKNKDRYYIYKYDNTKELTQNNLHLDTIAILTYINIQYLLDENQKEDIQKLLKNDIIIAEEEKRKLYNPDDIFKSVKTNKVKETSLVEVEKIKWYEKLFLIFKNTFKK